MIWWYKKVSPFWSLLRSLALVSSSRWSSRRAAADPIAAASAAYALASGLLLLNWNLEVRNCNEADACSFSVFWWALRAAQLASSHTLMVPLRILIVWAVSNNNACTTFRDYSEDWCYFHPSITLMKPLYYFDYKNISAHLLFKKNRFMSPFVLGSPLTAGVCQP